MARLRGTNVLNHVIRGHQAEDGYVGLKSDGYTALNTLNIDSVFSSMARTAAGLWTATLKEAQPCNLNYFNVVPQLHTGDAPYHFTLLTDTVGTTSTTNSTGATPQVIHFMFSLVSAPTVAADLPANAGFKYEVGLQLSTSYYTKVY